MTNDLCYQRARSLALVDASADILKQNGKYKDRSTSSEYWFYFGIRITVMNRHLMY